jgi:hypothetical protein
VNGPLSFAAVRFQLPADVDPQSATVVLSLDVAQTGNVGTPAVTACATTSAWTPGGDQAASSAPSYSCGGGRESVGVVSASGATETWSLGPTFLAPGSQATYDVALVPDPGAGTPFSVDYSQPTPSSVAITGPPAQGSSPSPAPADTTPPDTGFAAQPAPAVTFPVNIPAAVTPAPALATSPAPPTSAVAAPGARPAGGEAAAPAVASASGGVQGRRVMAAAVLVALGVALYLISRRPARAPKLIGAFASANAAPPPVPVRVRGIGRFAKPRSGPPPRLF